MLNVAKPAPAPGEASPAAPFAAAAWPIQVDGLQKAFAGTVVLSGITLAVEAGSMVALLGPSGCGKTTLLRCIAGLERPDHGTIVVGDRTLADPSTQTWLPPEQRRLGMVFQDWALFPHLSVAANVAYGLPKGPDRNERVAEALALVGLDQLGDRAPATLSGGQQQRVALARAIAPRPRVLLLDEPFSNLDSTLRVQVRTELHELLVTLGITTLFVTHDQEEAFVLGDEVAVMREGSIVQQATPAKLYAEPTDRWIAGFVGEANFFRSEQLGPGRALTIVGPIDIVLADAAHATGAVDVLVRPEALELDVAYPDAEVVDGAAGRVELVEFFGHDTISVVRLRNGEKIKVRHGGHPRAARGDAVAVRLSAQDAAIAYPAAE